MISDSMQLRPRYNEVDSMAYVYHANYLAYCHQARTELMRKMGIPDRVLEESKVMMPVLSFEIQYHRPAKYDELLLVHTQINEIPKIRMEFFFVVSDSDGRKICTAKSTVVFVDTVTRKPLRTPAMVLDAFNNYLNKSLEN
jgi:acyl-CoA thioester hydrolase